jgi:hypothetical protein
MTIWEDRFNDARWQRGPSQLPPAPQAIKIRAGVMLDLRVSA